MKRLQADFHTVLICTTPAVNKDFPLPAFSPTSVGRFLGSHSEQGEIFVVNFFKLDFGIRIIVTSLIGLVVFLHAVCCGTS